MLHKRKDFPCWRFWSPQRASNGKKVTLWKAHTDFGGYSSHCISISFFFLLSAIFPDALSKAQWHSCPTPPNVKKPLEWRYFPKWIKLYIPYIWENTKRHLVGESQLILQKICISKKCARKLLTLIYTLYTIQFNSNSIKYVSLKLQLQLHLLSTSLKGT